MKTFSMSASTKSLSKLAARAHAARLASVRHGSSLQAAFLTWKMIPTFILFLIVVAYSGQSIAEDCSRPSEPEVTGDRYRALQKRAAYAAFLAEQCGFDNEVTKRYRSMVRMIFDSSTEAQLKAHEEFHYWKRQFAAEATFLGIIKRCWFKRGKTRSFVNDVGDDVSEYADTITSELRKYSVKMEEWKACVERQRAAEEAEAYREEYARKKAVEGVQAWFRPSYMFENTFVLHLRNLSNQTADFHLRCCNKDGNCKIFRIALSADESKEIGFLEGWEGNFVPGEYCTAIYKGEELWRVTK